MPPMQAVTKQNNNRAQLEKISLARVKRIDLNLKKLVVKYQKALLNAAKPYFAALAQEVHDWDNIESKKNLTQATNDFLNMNLLGNKSIPKYTQPKGVAKKPLLKLLL